MRYWQHDETGRLLKIDIQMAPSKWNEITKEQYEVANMTDAELLRKSEEDMKKVKPGKFHYP